MASPASAPARARVALGVVAALAALGALLAFRAEGEPATLSARAATPPTGAPATAAATTLAPPRFTVTNATMPPLPLPDQLPTDYYAATPDVVLGRLRIPKLGVDEPLRAGITLTVVNKGPGWWPGTALPGQLGNMVVAGHRTTYSKPFERLDELVAGDQVVFALPERDYVYEVRGVIVVGAAHIGIAAQAYAHTATLFACHPKGSAAERIVAKLRLLKPDGTPADQDSWLPPVDQGADASGTTLVMRTPDDATVTGFGEAPAADG